MRNCGPALRNKTERIKEFKAIGNAVVGVLDSGAMAQGYANEEVVVVCQCCSVPGWVAEEVAQQIAQMLNAPKIHGIGFTMPSTQNKEGKT